jgi:hypothetical protein
MIIGNNEYETANRLKINLSASKSRGVRILDKLMQGFYRYSFTRFQ